MMVCELIRELLTLEQKSEILFVKRNDSQYIYVIGFMPDGTKVALECPTALEKLKENKTK